MSSPYVQTINSCLLGEAPHWDAEKQELYSVDIVGNYVYRFVPSTGETTRVKIEGELGVSFVVPVAGQPNQYIISSGRDVNLLEWDGHSSTPTTMRTIISVEPEYPSNKFNDAKVDSMGRLWAGTMNEDAPTGALYKIDKGQITTMETGISTGNGIAWNSDNTLMYYIDTPTRRVDVFDYNSAAGTISNRRTVYDFNTTGESGSPDGMTIDANGDLLVGCWEGNQIIHVNATTGTKIRSIPMPTSNITSAAFGGPNLDVLYVTSARLGLSDTQLGQQPAAGALFQITNLGVRGQAAGNAYILE